MAPANSKSLQLNELNQRSAPLASFDVAMFYPRIEDYGYTDKKTKKAKKGATFRCIVVSRENPQQYMVAELAMRAETRAPLEKALEKFKNGLCFRMSQTRLKNGLQQEYLHTPLKLVVDMNGTKFDPLMQSVSGDVTQLTAEPSMTVAHCKTLQSAQRFDLTALVLNVSDSRPGGTDREVRDVILIDGSKSKDNDKLVEMKISIFLDSGSNPTKTHILQLLGDVSGTDRSLSFFAIQCKLGKGAAPQFESSKEFFLLESTGSKAQQLKTEQPALALMSPEERETLHTAFSPDAHRDYTQEQGFQVFTLHLNDLLRPTGLTNIEEGPTLWQVHWAEVSWPARNVDSITTRAGDRLWFQTSVRDLVGVTANVWMNEASALALSGASDRTTFIKAWEEGDQLFPIMAAIKILRTAKEVSDESQQAASQSSEPKKSFINLTIVEACDQPLEEAPTRATLPLVHMLKESAHDTASIVPAALHQIETSPTYAFEITFDADSLPIVVPCQKVLALICSKTKSKPESIGAGYKLTTKEVQCVLGGEDSHHAAKTYNVTAVCTEDNMVSYRLDPPRGGTQFALVSITNKVEDAFVIESVQLLSKEQAKQAESSMRSLMNLVKHVGSRDRKRHVEWTQDASPGTAKKCSRLGRALTDAPMPAHTA